MSANTNLIYDTKRKILAKYRRFGSELAVANIEFRDNLKYHTAATDGKNIYLDPNYFASLSENDRMFIIAHEIMHIKFMHMFRLKDKNGQKRDLEIWNTATDAIINANLERDGFTIKEGYINMPEALNYSAEEMYQRLLQEKKQREQSQQSGNGQGNNSEQNGKKSAEEDKIQDSDHSLWEEAFKQQQQKSEKKENEQDEKQEEQIDSDIDEREEFEDNRKEKREKFKARREKTQKDIRSNSNEKIKLGDIGESREHIDWKTLIRREIKDIETTWSQRRSIAENNYAYRLEENDIEEDSETEIMIDVSGSVKIDLVKAFLRQIKPLLKQSKLRVGCFNEKFWGFVDIRSVRDIDNFTIPKEARGHASWTEDWDLAVRSFTKKREINKIVFTDGYPCPGTMPKDDLRGEKVIWLVYGNKDFKPCCGKVINITQKQLEQLNQVYRNIE